MLRRYAVTLLLVIACLVSPTIAQAQSSDVLQSAGIEIGLQPSQASASALLQLPSVYAKPGSLIYWLKSTIEQIQYILSSTPESRAQLLLDFSQQRLAEGYQAIQNNDPQAATEALTKYQQQQQELSNYLNLLGLEQLDIKPYLDKLKQQLGIQQALQDYVEQQLDDPKDRSQLTSLLQVQPNQLLAFHQQQETVVLGQKNRRIPSQATPSATPSATPKP